jgi:hypothetical protein
MKPRLVSNSCNELVRRGESRAIQTTRRSVSGIFAFRGEQGIAFESTLERDFLMRMEPVFCVLDVAPQPIRLSYRTRAGRMSHYTPDFLVQYRLADRTWSAGRRPLLVEVKPRAVLRADWLDLRPKFKAAARYARDNGWEFRIFDEGRIRDATWENAMFLRPYRGQTFARQEVQPVLDTLRSMGDAPVQYLVGRHFLTDPERLRGYALIWSLLARGEIECDFARPLAWDTDVWMPSDE